MSEWVMWAHFRHICFNSFPMIKEFLNPLGFGPYNYSLNIRESTGTPTPNVKIPLGMWGSIPSHSFALLRTCGMIPGLPSWPTTLQPLCLGRDPKARVATIIILTKKIHLLTFFFFKRMVIKILLNNYIQFNFFQMILDFQKEINVITYIIEFFYKVNWNHFIWTKFQ